MQESGRDNLKGEVNTPLGRGIVHGPLVHQGWNFYQGELDKLPVEERQLFEERLKLKSYGGEEADLIHTAYENFLRQYGNDPRIASTNYGIYHGGEWIIGIVRKKGTDLDYNKDIPVFVGGFRLMLFEEL